MTDRPSFTDESVLMKTMKLEIGKFNIGMMVERKTLFSFFIEKRPSARTRSGDLHFFDRSILQVLADRLPKEIKDTLRLPIPFISISKSETVMFSPIPLLQKP